MKTQYIAITIGVLSFVIMISFFIHISNYVTIKTDWSSYANYHSITVSGEVSQIQGDSPVLIQVFHSNGDLYNSSKIALIDGSNVYSYQFKIDKPMQIGTYDFTVKATYAGHSATTSFQYVYSEAPGMRLPSVPFPAN